ncbi:protein artichoke-like [Mytilus trossulus]|uniref:protein artichoke-like n=1 Tax=Mytilus trossulus TaxID=6551 RepID=UPI003006D962
MKSVLLQLLFLTLLLHGSFQYNTYPRRYVRDHSAHLEACPLHCRCMDLNQRSARGLFDSWNVDQSWQNTEPDETGRSVVCQGLRELPARIPSDATKLTVYGDSSSMRSRGTRHTDRHLISETQIQYINRNVFRDSVAVKEIIMSGNNIAIMFPSAFHYLRSLQILSLTNNNIRHLSAAVFNGLGNLQELRLSDNMIKFLPYTVFTYLTELKSLYLNGNKIKMLPRDVLKPLVNLEVLDLSRNNISDFYDATFDHNVNLQELLLNGNRLWKIRPRWFQNLYSLRSLSLRGNAIIHVPAKSFANLFNLEELLLSANHIEDIENGAFNNLRDVKSLDLSTNDLSEIRSSYLNDLDSLSELFLSNNKVVQIKNGTFDFIRYLKKLDLSRNDISIIETGSFSSMRQLQILDLSYNKMLKFKKGIAYGIENLEEIHLDNNFISGIDDGAFMTSNVERLSKMKLLNLEQNNIKKIDAKTLKGMPRLNTLRLGNNNIRKIHPQAMATFIYLETLTLNNNKLRDLNNGMFSNLQNVYSIDISNNKIRSISENTFLGLDKLEDLLMAGNKVNSINKLAFRALPSLSSLDLKENKLVSFNFSFVTNMAQLTVMDLSKNHLFWIDIPPGAYLRLKDLLLSNNNLQTLSSNIKHIMGRSSILSLDNNPWDCDCQLKWVVQPLKNVRLDTSNDAMCKSPPKLHGTKFSELADEDMTCSQKVNASHDVTLMCKDGVFSKRPIARRRSVGKEMMKKHVTVFRNRGDYVVDGAMLTPDWALVPAGALRYLTDADIHVKIGRGKTSYKISHIVQHPLLSLGMQQFNIALLRLVKKKSSPVMEHQCIIAEKQFKSLSQVLPVFYVSIRLDGKKPKTKLKIRKGKVNHRCANDKDYICGVLKGNKNDAITSVDGSPLYIGHSTNLRLAGIGTHSWSNQKSQYIFIPLWTISDWADDIMIEFNEKCTKQKSGKLSCDELTLPSTDDLFMKIRKTEQH